MTVASEVSSVSHAGDGVTLAFAIPFRFLSSADISVIRRDADLSVSELTTGFSITGAGGSGGTCTFVVAPSADVDIIISRAPEILQPADYTSNDAFPAEATETALDRQAFISQYLGRLIQHCISVPYGDSLAGSGVVLPSADSRASKYLAFGVSGNLELAALTSSGDLSSSIIATMLDSLKRTAAEIAAGVTPVNYAYPPGDVLRYGVNAVPGTTDMTAAFTTARTVTSGRYNISVPGVYLVDASPDVWADSFTACGGAWIKIGAITTDVSNAIAGRLRYAAVSNELTWLVDARTGDLIQGWQNNIAGRATYFNRGLSITSDSHAIQMLPTGATDSIDILMQRSTLNADPSGNRFSFTYDQVNDRWQFSYATSASGAPAFDTWMECGAGLAPYLHFPSLQPQFQQGYSIKRRAAGGLCIECFGDATTVRWRNQDTPANINMIFGDNAIAFLGATPAARQSITGTTADEKIDSVIALLVAFGLGTDNTT
jgi:hypothetical protein